jgi:hypothetical protein
MESGVASRDLRQGRGSSPFRDHGAEIDEALDSLSDKGIGGDRRELNPSIAASQTTVLPLHYDRHGGCLDHAATALPITPPGGEPARCSAKCGLFERMINDSRCATTAVDTTTYRKVSPRTMRRPSAQRAARSASNDRGATWSYGHGNTGGRCLPANYGSAMARGPPAARDRVMRCGGASGTDRSTTGVGSPGRLERQSTPAARSRRSCRGCPRTA